MKREIFIKRNENDVDVSEELINQVAKQNNIPPLLSKVLLNRGMDKAAVRKMIHGGFEDLHSPFLFKEMDVAVERINEAVKNNENVVIWGDFDCDGVSATSILMLELSHIFAPENLSYYLPNRVKEGYGVNSAGIKKLKEERDIDLIITVDCGITSMEEVEYAKTLGIDMIVTDHHRADKGRPDAYAVINPKVEGETYPFDGLCGAGVAAKLAQGVLGDRSLMRTIDIVALATVADLVPLEDENRIFVKAGLKAINHMKRPAIEAMSEYALKTPDETVKAYHFGFQYGPMINASGRLGDAKDAVELFITQDNEKRKFLAHKLNEYNTTRKERERMILEEVEEKLENKKIKNSVIVYGSGWEPGVVGIVASRILEQYNLPSIVLTHVPEKKVYRGSGRSVPGIDLYDALFNNEEYLGNWGGHAPAAGLEVKEDKIEEFIEAFEKYLDSKYEPEDFIPKTKYDLMVNMNELNMEFVENLEKLEPTGIGNPKVALRSRGIEAQNLKKIGETKEHFSAEYTDETGSVKGVTFFNEPPTTSHNLDIIFKPSINEFRNFRNLQLMVDSINEEGKPVDPVDPDDDSTKPKTTTTTTPAEEDPSPQAGVDVSNNYEENKEKVKAFSFPPSIIPIEDFVANKTKVNQFKRAGIENNIDLLSYAPKKFYDFTQVYTLNDLYALPTTEGLYHIVAKLTSLKVSGNHLFGEAVDTNGMMIKLTWFNQGFLMSKLKTQEWYSFCGSVELHSYFGPQMNPVLFSRDLNEFKRLIPEYKKIKGMSDDYLKDTISKALELTDNTDFLEEELVKKYNLIPQKQSFVSLHYPRSAQDIKAAADRSIFETLFKFNFRLNHVNQDIDIVNEIHVEKRELVDKIISDLPFELTIDQKKTVDESIDLMNGDNTLKGLVQGDVGSGKTIVSLLLMVAVAENGYQSALIAPTEVLAKQHYEELVELVEPYGIRVGYLAGSLKAKEKREVLAKIKNHDVDLVVGTHSIIQDTVEFVKLGLVVVDEQHRFGVEQREKLRNREPRPHIVTMSATPIPRTLSMAVYGDHIKVFNIKSMPSGRLPIKTEILMNDKEVYDFMYKEISKGRQAYMVCPLIEESTSDKMKEIQSLETEFENIKNYFKNYSDVKIEMISGKMKQNEIREKVGSFEKGETDVLLSTTIIEVGVNVPNASVMVIKSSDRFGLAQLHQLRGRVGRGKYQSYCILQPSKEDVKANIIKSTTDGFKIAEEDLKLRGPGNFLGNRQSGEDRNVSLMLTFNDLYDKIGDEVQSIFASKERFSKYDWLLLYDKNEKEVDRDELKK